MTDSTITGVATGASALALRPAMARPFSRRGFTRVCSALVATASVAALSGCAAGPRLALAPSVDLDRYLGRWYIIANIPYFAERGEVGSYVEYARRPDGTIIDRYFGHAKTFDAPLTETSGHGYVVPGSNDARWRVTFFWPIYVTYPILYVDPDYTIALVGYPDRSLGWIFSRSPSMTEARYTALLGRFASQGYDVSAFRRVPQTPEQIGLPGFQ